jgi:transcriptional regulator with XRE-family HTH domain
MRNSKTINPQRLAELRERLGLSQKALAAKLRVDVGTVSRWEQGKIRRVRRDVFGKLCATLNTDRDELCGDGPLPTTSVTERAAEKGKLPVAISTFARNALTLVADRYGLEQDQIIELAPLLFFMAAERSLKDRRDFVREQREAINTVSNLRTHLPFAIRDIEPALAIEETSIQKRDLFGDLIVEEVTNAELESEADWEAGDYSGALQKNPFDLDFWESDSKDPNPFRSFLTKGPSRCTAAKIFGHAKT